MKKIGLFFIIFFKLTYSQELGSFSNWIRDEEDIQTQVISPELQVFFKIEQKVFFIGENIHVDIYIKNNSSDNSTVLLTLDKNLYNSLELNLFDEKNTRQRYSMNYLNWLEEDSKNVEESYLYDYTEQMEKQSIELKYGDSFITRMNLNDYFEIDRSTSYYLDGDFVITININESSKKKIYYPLGQVTFKTSSQRDFRVVPTDNIFLNRQEEIEYQSPDLAVKAFIESQQKMEWKTHFQTIDISKLLKNSYSSSVIRERYVSSVLGEKKMVLSDFKDYLIETYNYDIENYDIIKVLTTGDNSTVWVSINIKKNIKKWSKVRNIMNYQIEEKWEVVPYTYTEESPIYIFRLEKLMGLWKIVEKEVSISKKEAVLEVENRGIQSEDILENIYFRLGTYEIDEEYKSTLHQIANYLKISKNTQIEISGFTDNTGNRDFNNLLSRQRALRVRQYLVDEEGVDPKSIHLIWYGEENPVSISNELNRRVEIRIIYNDS